MQNTVIYIQIKHIGSSNNTHIFIAHIGSVKGKPSSNTSPSSEINIII